jgi:hypothetical protein
LVRSRLLRYHAREEDAMKASSRCAIYTCKSSEEGLEQSFNFPACPARSLRSLRAEPEA